MISMLANLAAQEAETAAAAAAMAENADIRALFAQPPRRTTAALGGRLGKAAGGAPTRTSRSLPSTPPTRYLRRLADRAARAGRGRPAMHGLGPRDPGALCEDGCKVRKPVALAPAEWGCLMRTILIALAVAAFGMGGGAQAAGIKHGQATGSASCDNTGACTAFGFAVAEDEDARRLSDPPPRCWPFRQPRSSLTRIRRRRHPARRRTGLSHSTVGTRSLAVGSGARRRAVTAGARAELTGPGSRRR